MVSRGGPSQEAVGQADAGERTRRANDRKSAVRARVEHVFAEQKDRMGLFIRTIGLARAGSKVGLVNLVHNMRRPIWLGRNAIA
jgi:hypothetical protein